MYVYQEAAETYIKELSDEKLWSRHHSFQYRWMVWFCNATNFYYKTNAARDAYYGLRDELMQKDLWCVHWLYDKMQSTVVAALGIVPEQPAARIKQVRVRQSRFMVRPRTLPYLGGITGRMRQR
jgi:hypothetical protein